MKHGLRVLLKLLLPILVLAIAFQIGRTMLETAPDEEAPPPVQPAGQAGDIATVSVLSVARESAAPQVQLFGRLRPDRRAFVTPAAPGEVARVNVQVGDRVAAGAELFALSTDNLARQQAQQQARIRSLEAAVREETRAREAAADQLDSEQRLLELAEQAVERTRNLRGRNLASAADLDAAEQNLESRRQALRQQELVVAGADDRLVRQEAQLDEARLQAEQIASDLADTSVEAPFEGWVVQRTVEAGTRAAADQGVELVSVSPVWVDAVAPLALAEDLNEGMVAEWAAVGGRRAGTATLDSWLPDSENGRIELQFQASGTPDAQRLPYGSAVPLWLNLPEVSEVLLLPEQAIYNGDTLYRVSDGQLEPVEAEVVGYRYSGGRVQVIARAGSLGAGEQVLVTRVPEAVRGLPVRLAGDGS